MYSSMTTVLLRVLYVVQTWKSWRVVYIEKRKRTSAVSSVVYQKIKNTRFFSRNVGRFWSEFFNTTEKNLNRNRNGTLIGRFLGWFLA